jgi:CRISPR-associated protein Cmr6
MGKKDKKETKKSLQDLGNLLPEDTIPAIPKVKFCWDNIKNPLQVLNHEPIKVEYTEGRRKELVKPVLETAIETEKSCRELYKYLTDKTKSLACETFTAKFPWRLRVGGTRGIKGVISSWAKKNADQNIVKQVDTLLGYLDDKKASIGRVQILDAFPTQPCLSMDIATPIWKWDRNEVKYDVVPHHSLSLEQASFVIGVTYTSIGTANDVEIVLTWLKQALSQGIGSRVSAGYGKTACVDSLPYSANYKLSLWTQGIFGGNPKKAEFRPVSLRGTLRYWFRAVALGIYHPDECKSLESKLFGTIEPTAIEGSIRITIDPETSVSNESKTQGRELFELYTCSGKILLSAKQEAHLKLIEKILQLASHFGGIGKGSRRPLHKNDGRSRGCYWELDNFQIACNKKDWESFFNDVRNAFLNVQNPRNPIVNCSPGRPGNRYQDVFNQNTKVYLVPHTKLELLHPKEVRDWFQIGAGNKVIGKALELLYSSDDYKGQRRNEQGVIVGNKNVGGNLGTPSYVIIKSNFPKNSHPYQIVTIFGADEPERNSFAQAVKRINGTICISTTPTIN